MAKISSLIKSWLNPALTAEQQMLAYAQNPEPALLKPLVERFSDDLFHFLMAQAGASYADDVLQQTWLKVIEKRQSFRAGTSVKSWLFTIARNTLLDELRRTQRWDFSDVDEVSADGKSGSECEAQLSHISTEQRVSDNEQRELSQQEFQAMLQSLTLAQREAVVLQLEGFSIEEIASITSEKRETIKSRLRYAKQALKKHMVNFNPLDEAEHDCVAGKECQ